MLKKGLTNAVDRADAEKKRKRKALRDRLDLQSEHRQNAKDAYKQKP